MKRSMGAAPGVLGNKWLALGLLALFVPLGWRAWSKLTTQGEAATAMSLTPTAPAQTSPAESKAAPHVKPSPADLALFMDQDQRRTIPSDRDPFRAYPSATVATEESLPNLRLEGVSANGDRARSLAVIGDRVLAEGEEIDGFVVETIAPLRVTLRRGERTFVLELLPPTTALEGLK